MTNEELKKKICKIIADNYLPKEMPDRLEDYKLYRFKRAADALIAEGLKFDTIVSHTATFDLMQQEYINSLERRCAQAEHRAEVSERALLYAVSEYRCDECPCEECNAEIRGSNECIDLIIKTYKEQVEKELAEEGKDD